jgi:hypothetical protein
LPVLTPVVVIVATLALQHLEKNVLVPNQDSLARHDIAEEHRNSRDNR